MIPLFYYGSRCAVLFAIGKKYTNASTSSARTGIFIMFTIYPDETSSIKSRTEGVS